jgi:rhodanese-related sulfurtransferase
MLKGMGYKKVRNLAGGIDAWAVKFDDKMPRY